MIGKHLTAGKTVFIANRVENVHGWNEVLFHFAHCMHVHLLSDKTLASSQGNYSEPPSKMANLGINEASAATSGLGSISGTLNPIQNTVLRLYSENKTVEGVHIMAAVRKFGEKYPEAAVRQTVQWLLDEGYLYLTMDNDHAKSVLE